MDIKNTASFFKITAGSVLLVFLFHAGALFSASSRYRIVWSGDASTTATIAWDQQSGDDPIVYYGTKDFGVEWQKYPAMQKPTRQEPDYRGMNNIFARLQNLKPDQAYYFVIKDSDGVGKRFWFRTAPDSQKAFTFIAGGDTKSNGSALLAGRQSNRMVAKLRPLFVIFSGDFTSGNGKNPKYWQQWLDDWFRLTTTSDGRIIPIIPVHGNHEDGEKSVLHNIFDVPYQGDNPKNIYYDVAFANMFAVLALNSQIDTGGEQQKWLEEKLTSYENYTFKAAAYHKPFFPHTSGKSEHEQQYQNWARIFFVHGLDLSFDADSHMSKITFPLRPSEEPDSFSGFIRDDVNGTLFLGEGSWGASPRPNNDNKPWTLRSGSFNQLKWLQVFPAENGQPASIDIRTVITAKKGEDGIVPLADQVQALSEENVFAVPQGITLFSTQPYGDVIHYPFSE